MKWNDAVLLTFGLTMGVVVGAILEASALPYKLLLGNDGRLQWETLLTGVAALAAATLTVAKLNDQIRQTEQLASDQRQRRQRAARAVLPLALSELSDYAKACMIGLNDLRPCFQSDGSLDRLQVSKIGTTWTMPSLPENILSVFKEALNMLMMSLPTR